MRLARRLHKGTKRACSCITLSFLFTLSACTLPYVDIQRRAKPVTAPSNGFSKIDEKAPTDPHAGDKNYLATVRIRFSDSGSADPITFDVRKTKTDLVSFNVSQTEHTTTLMHLGYSHDEGGVAGFRFAWHF